ncbi:gamma-glutamyl-gamma-aminobutyrate hydrolase family protein [Paenactinomyces guangxiensis]|uniref:Gamma-glutamyl-gamma-aminobutyrate hydrolase family protein n=1 Tax=Paenactinomyces guangxiensis TaxID=1490290 RepID=A0A7W2A8F4_9BACL|nr:gamma-glutamyl-gamma-aminobutyrate hydrolase family protein [Paenactinomyces guangxiensis]MBA4494585.1 gamma-glutamyl-gamma-aminobutyrate hydrolase family protein [Paenactinomyces guangxiensis]MBH8591652.1 gamma-glutamyl-gamma-aminobutyrate hydrolase family protein [Paenactinomyces guangxiensis]
MKSSPIIGVTGYHVRGEEGVGGTFRGLPGQGFSVVGHDYIHAVEKVGGIALGIPVGKPSSCRTIVEKLDGLILSGGEDIDPSLYGERPDMNCWTLAPERDRFELELLKEALQVRKPVLAICRGLQLFNVLFGGTLYKDLSDAGEKTLSHQFNRAPRWYLAHRVRLIHPGLKEIFGAQEIETNSYHHQGIKELGKGVEITAVAEDGIIEGIFHPDYPNVLAIQWHPETMAVQFKEGLLPFRWLMKQICQKGGNIS